jgi:hypothetical protein
MLACHPIILRVSLISAADSALLTRYLSAIFPGGDSETHGLKQNMAPTKNQKYK